MDPCRDTSHSGHLLGHDDKVRLRVFNVYENVNMQAAGQRAGVRERDTSFRWGDEPEV